MQTNPWETLSEANMPRTFLYFDGNLFFRFIDDERLTANGFDICLKTGEYRTI